MNINPQALMQMLSLFFPRQKGPGYFGTLGRPDENVSTELSVGVGFDGKETEIPSLVPTLTQEEIDYLLAGNPPTEAIIKKATEHARARMKYGLDPFAQKGEQQVLPKVYE